MTDSPISAPLLELENMIGFGGQVQSGLKAHPDKQHLVYPVGCTIVIEDIGSKKQEFLSGHTNSISCIAVSRSGRYIASGQVTDSGFKADIIIWDFHSRSMYCKLTLHHNMVEALAFSPNDQYLVSLGGQDDGSVVVWSIARKEAICGSPAQVMSAGLTHTVCYSNTSEDIFVTGGSGTLRVWELDVKDRKIRPTEVQMGQLKRVIRCIEMAEDDSFFYCGTSTGDIIAVNMTSKFFQAQGPKELFSLGVTSLSLLANGELLVGTGDGTVAVVKDKDSNFKKTKKVAKLEGAVTSLALRGKGHQFYVGTAICHIYRFKFAEFTYEMQTTCHYDVVNDLCFPKGCSDLLATCSRQEIRIWNTNTGQEMLRITVPNMTCLSLAIMPDGKTICSGWDDGRIRGFYPESGKPKWIVENAGGGPVTALAVFSDNTKIVSGSAQGNVAIWDVPTIKVTKGPTFLTKHSSLKEHKAQITRIHLRKDDSECVTSSKDGSCIIWDLRKLHRTHMIRVNTLFMNVCFHPAEHQLLASGTDRKISCWEKFDASLVRELDGSNTGSLNALDISSQGSYFVSAGDDKLVKCWLYDEGECTHIGIGHSAPIIGVKISPNEKFIVSISADGAILKWKFPH